MIFGISWDLQPFMPQIQAAQQAPPQAGRNWFLPFLRSWVTGAHNQHGLDGGHAWHGTAEGRAGLEGEPRADFKALCWTCALACSFPAALIVGLGGCRRRLAAMVILAPIAGYAPSILRTKKMPQCMRGR